jgi:hypothetical protein
VEYTLKRTNAPIGVATYSFDDKLPDEVRSLRPSPEEIAEVIHSFGSEDNAPV